MVFQAAVRCYFRWQCDDKIAMILPFPQFNTEVYYSFVYYLYQYGVTVIKLQYLISVGLHLLVFVCVN